MSVRFGLFLLIVGAFHLEGVPEESPTRVTPIPSRVHLESASGHVDYPYPQLSVPVVSNFLISRPVLLQICNTYLKTEKFADGASLMARVYPLLLSNDLQMRQKANRAAEVRIPQEKIFSMPCQLITKDLGTVYTDKFVDPELVLFFLCVGFEDFIHTKVPASLQSVPQGRSHLLDSPSGNELRTRLRHSLCVFDGDRSRKGTNPRV